ncbi:MAG: hypothetical protein HY600_01595, partial [Candidatus Omnitrophica bacterium]|nr:hypothetical protein [Candidatus Omnitrophota bacterium]
MTARQLSGGVVAGSLALPQLGSAVPMTLATPPAAAPRPAYGDVVFLGAIMAPASTPGPAARGRPRHRPLDPDPLP